MHMIGKLSQTLCDHLGQYLYIIIAIAVGCLSHPSIAHSEEAPAAANAMENIRITTLSANRVQVEIKLSQSVTEPISFTTENPARVVFDFPNTVLKVEKKSQDIELGLVRGVMAAESKGRTRMMIKLAKLVPYQTRIEGNRFFVILDTLPAATLTPLAAAKLKAGEVMPSINAVDFRRGEKGEARLIITLTHPNVPFDIREEGGMLITDFSGTNLPKHLRRRLDVTDFATPVTTIDSFAQDNLVRFKIAATGEYEHLAYQAGNIITLEVKPISKEEKARARQISEDGYVGDKLSLSFQNIEVRAALQIIADFTSINMITSDTVTGNISLRLENVPWDQALDIILKTKGLGKRQMGDIMMIAPSEEIAAREKQELEARKQITEIEPLKSEIVQINYAKATDFANLLKSKENSLLSARGNVTVDTRTNTLLIQDTISRLDEIRKVIVKLDQPVRQVLIESRIVIANNDFTRELGTRFGVTNGRTTASGAGVFNSTNGFIGSTGTTSGTDTMVNNATPGSTVIPPLGSRYNVNLPVTTLSNPGRIALAVLDRNWLVDLELSALQAEGRGEVISSPRVLTANQKEAFVEQGVEIPYLEASSSGSTSVSFKKAVLSLKVTPQITPDDRVIMDLQVNKDNVGEVYAGVPSINTREISTQVLVDNGETVVLGGIYEQTKLDSVNKIPLLGDIPVLGHLFRNKLKQDDKAELLIFVTPKILKESLGLR